MVKLASMVRSLDGQVETTTMPTALVAIFSLGEFCLEASTDNTSVHSLDSFHHWFANSLIIQEIRMCFRNIELLDDRLEFE